MALSLQEMDRQTADLLPAREVMTNSCGRCRSHGDNYGNGNGNQNGNTYQEGLINISALNGNFNGNFNGNRL
jgi:hypothetical protein